MEQHFTATLFLDGATGELLVHAVRVAEEVSRPFRIEIDFDTVSLDAEALRGSKAQLVLADPFAFQRDLSGIVQSVEVLATSEDLTRWRVVLVPHTYQLAYRHGFRIFQELSVPDIAQKLIENAGLDAALLELDLNGSYPTREYCVQYDESEWDFLCRLLEEEGIWFTFRHDPDGHVMELWDDSSLSPKLDPAELTFENDALLRGTSVNAWSWRSRARASVAKATLNDYDPLRPSLSLLAEESAGDDPFGRETYEHPGRYSEPAEGKRLAKTRLEELRSGLRSATASTNALYVFPGRRLTLAGHPTADGDWFVTRSRVDLRLVETEQPDPLLDAGPQRYDGSIAVVPSSQLFRPARTTPRPRIAGLQTARVTGPSGEEIHCDEHGRVKVQFHWDLDGQLDDKTSCWIRVSQQHTTGSISIPRVGWEVLVEFQDGDPDRPIVFGKLFNPFFPPPYALPDQKTVTGLRTESLPGRGGTNEILFDDAAGAEQISITGHYDVQTTVANNRTLRVGNSAVRSVGVNRTSETSGNETVTVKGNQQCTVTVDHTITVSAARTVRVNGAAAEEITGSHTMTVGGMEFMKVGSLIAGALEVVASRTINAAVGAAAGAAQRAAANVLGPMMPAIESARGAVGQVAQVAGPAAGLLAPGNPQAAVFGSAMGSISDAAGAASAGEIATRIGGLMASKAAAAAGHQAIANAAAGEGGGDGAGGAAGTGAWDTTAGGSVSESIGGASMIIGVNGASFAVGGGSTEMIGAARLEKAKAKLENVSVAKAETVGVYMVKAATDIAIDAKGAIALNIAAGQKQSIGGSHTLSSDAAARVTTSKASLVGAGGVSVNCGMAKIAVSSSGVSIEGLKVTFEASEILVDPPAIKPG